MNVSLARWIGPGLAALGSLGIVLLEQQSLGSRTLISWWVLERALSPEKALPLLGFGAAIGLLSRIQMKICVTLFLLGASVGFFYHDAFVTIMAFVPNAADHLFLASPISLIAAGILLIVPASFRRWLGPGVAMLISAMLAQIIALTDPTIDSHAVSLIGVGLGLWAIMTASLCIRSFYRDWFPVGLRIVGSWLLAIGVLYGGASFVPPTDLPSLPDENLQAPPMQNALPDLNSSPSGPAPEELPAQP